MTIYITKQTKQDELERMFLEAAYSGERFLIQREDGVSFAIVPSEDLQMLGMIDQSGDVQRYDASFSCSH